MSALAALIGLTFEPTIAVIAPVLVSTALIILPALLKQLFLNYIPDKFPLIVRPEKLVLSAQKNKGIVGTIHQSFFMGGFWLVEVVVFEKIICVQTLNSPWAPGTPVWVSSIEPV